ncbi:MAG: pentapeptide repeat-containing protein [Moorea sp. SIO2I5]|nr:pentapeptide repeat-containing protein [Moorena sp. SIO2I5]
MPFFSSADLSDANLKGADLTDANLSRAIVDNTQFGDNSGLDESIKLDLIERGAMFEDVAGDSSESLTPSQIPQTNAIKGKNAIASTKKRDRLKQIMRSHFFCLCDRLNQKMGIAKSWDQYQWGGHPACLGILITGKMPVPR